MKKRNILLILLSSLMLIIPMTAELWSSSAPLVMIRGHEVYFPALKNYHPEEFGHSDKAVMTRDEYLNLNADWKLWAPNPWSPEEIDKEVTVFPGPPTPDHIMGTDILGRDIFAIILYGLRVAYFYSFVICTITLCIGFFVGGFFGYSGGVFDLISQRVVELLSLIPSFFLILMALSMFESSMYLLVIINSILGWIGISQMTRVETLKIRKLGFVEAATALGDRPIGIFFKHVFPHAIIPALTMLPFLFMGHIVGLAVLDYLGLGVSSEYPSLGALIAQGQHQINNAWWIIFWPSMILTLFLMGWVFISEEVRKLRSHY